RVSTMAEKESLMVENDERKLSLAIGTAINLFQFDQALGFIWRQVKDADTLINEKEVWKQTGEEKKEVLTDLVNRLRQIGADLQPFLPETAKKVLAMFAEGKIKRGENLFNRLDRK
ncbi:MAG: methionine--tRNA ligase, partial [Patescibacteria group bacterium]